MLFDGGFNKIIINFGFWICFCFIKNRNKIKDSLEVVTAIEGLCRIDCFKDSGEVLSV